MLYCFNMPISLKLDDNRVATLGGTLNTDGKTVVAIKVNPVGNGIKVDDNTTGSSFASTTSQRDANRKTAIWGVSSADFKTPVYIAVNSEGQLLIDSS